MKTILEHMHQKKYHTSDDIVSTMTYLRHTHCKSKDHAHSPLYNVVYNFYSQQPDMYP